VNRTVGILAGFAALAAGAYLGNMSWAQQQPQYTQQQAPLQARSIAFVNLSQVIKNYQKYKTFQEQLKSESQRVQSELENKRNTAVNEQKQLEQPSLASAQREQIEKDIKRIQREMQDSMDEAKSRIQKAEFDQFVVMYKEIKEAVEVYARSYAIELVLQYSDPVNQADFYSPPFFQQKLVNRACMPVYLDPRMDISDAVTSMLNRRLASAASPQGHNN
jgi:Skp family chaperone for outer membrane proteins